VNTSLVDSSAMRPETQFEDDVLKHTPAFKESAKKMSGKREYFYAPYDLDAVPADSNSQLDANSQEQLQDDSQPMYWQVKQNDKDRGRQAHANRVGGDKPRR